MARIARRPPGRLPVAMLGRAPHPGATRAIAALTLATAGTGYTNGTGYAATFPGGTAYAAATATFDVVGNAVTNLQLTDGGRYSHFSARPSISFAAGGPGSGAAATFTFT